MLKPCQFRQVTDDGQLVCAKVSGASREVSVGVCEACPVAAIDCQHLRVSLAKRDGGGIVVRYGNGRTEVWDGEPAGVHMERAACARLCVQVSGPQMCAACALHSPASSAGRSAVERRGQAAETGAGKIIAIPVRQAKRATCWTHRSRRLLACSGISR